MKSRYNIFIALLLAACSLFGCVEPEQEIPVTVRLNKEMISSLSVGATQTLVATVMPEDADVSLVWASDKEEVAEVDAQGKVIGVAPGTAVISVTAGEAVAECKVTVVALKPEKISLEPKEIELEADQQYELEVIYTPAEASASDLEWSVDKSYVATVDKDGKVTAKSEGTCVVIAKCNKGKLAAACHVTVVNKEEHGNEDTVVKAESIVLEPSTLELNVGSEWQVRAAFYPENAVVTDLEWKTTDESVATVSDGKVKALKVGSATVTATCNGGELSATCEVTVSEVDGDHSITGVTLSAPTTDVQVDKPLQLEAVYEPKGATPNRVSWTIDNQGYADVNQNGLVTGKSASKLNGEWQKVVVTVTADGYTAYINLTVIPRQPDGIELDMPAEGFIRVGQEWKFNPRVIPEGLGYQVYCAASLPDGKPNNDAYGSFVPTTPGEIKGIFAVSSHENLVYENIRKEVYLPVKPYYVETISLPETKETETGSSFILTPEFTSDVEGHEPTYKDVKWTSSDEAIATVDSYGKVTALAAGTVHITATTSNGYSVPSGQPQKSATCKLTIKEATLQINVGDYYYSDGTWSSELNPSKTVIGVVFARANSASSDALLAKDYPDCVHGLVLSIVEYEQSCTSNRSWLRADLIKWMGEHGYNQWLVDDKYCGYNNTQGLLALNAAKVKSGEDVIHVNHVDAVLQHREKVKTPSGASAWYMPSYMEMVELSNNLDAVNASLAKVGGTTLRRTYEYVYDKVTGGTPIPSVGTAEQHYYYSNNIAEDKIYAYNMNTDQLVNPKVSTSPWDSVSGEGTPLPVRVVLAF